ncbi:cytochrome c3 family protein [Desulfurivibrio alkaliphilus]|uniref:Uncharacterized protein n=1 Tax=Desulfurivibrio alkaliphilus (strain DSM 19089 / UNIQEM U267 / AHT2) TaxID=589865 RepID=D6Z1N0_DESAT|nr:cytochrome c3 family protein [Desulfurivibrio alkaliphilus]ADH85455.1 hypothetical protein DaAHT2_0751 [Desulfurivibrio alkaliphilus AHT 2]
MPYQLPPSSPTLLTRRFLPLGRLLPVAAALLLALAWGGVIPPAGADHSGPYRQSAHGSGTYGVEHPSRSAEGYARGNCGHCHLLHGSAPDADPAGPYPHALFAPTDQWAEPPYGVADNICFACHSGAQGTVMQVENLDYATRYGGFSDSPSDPSFTSVLAAFNAPVTVAGDGSTDGSAHNLHGIHQFMLANQAHFPWYDENSNPCTACHNVHLAQRRQVEPGQPPTPVISKPTAPNQLWGGAGETMAEIGFGGYQPPYWNIPGKRHEPRPAIAAEPGLTPDYVAFCTTCHNPQLQVWSTALGRYLKPIDWGPDGDKHGGAPRDDYSYSFTDSYGLSDYNDNRTLEPYHNHPDGNLVLSCLDCHDPHGSYNAALIRWRINARAYMDSMTNYDYPISRGPFTDHRKNITYVCSRCHPYAGATHHGYKRNDYGDGLNWRLMYESCYDCHADPGYPAWQVNCLSCHGHGSTMVDKDGNLIKTF